MKKLGQKVLIFMLALALMLSLTACHKSDSSNASSGADTTADGGTTEKNTAVETATASTFDLNSYVGDWGLKEQSGTHLGDKISVISTSGSTATLTIYKGSTVVIDHAEVTVSSNQGTFKTDTLTGNITFGNGFITVVILESSDNNIPVGTRDVYES